MGAKPPGCHDRTITMTLPVTHISFQKAWIILGLLVLCLGTGVTTAQAEESRDTSNRIRRLENEVQTLSRAIYKGETPPPGSFSGGEDAANLSVRIDQIETQMRDMTGKLEEQSYQLNQLKDQLERMTNDMSMRTGGGSLPQPPVPAPGVINPMNETPPYQAPPQPETSYGATPPGPDMSGYQWSSKGGNESYLGSIGPEAANDPGALAYESAFSLLKNGQYDGAEQGFTGFLTQYPVHALAGNAKYWLGETYYARAEYEKASRVFAEAYQQYPKSQKAPDNLLKLGMSLSSLGKKDDACIALGQIGKEFSTSAGPVLRRAEQEMSRLGCGG